MEAITLTKEDPNIKTITFRGARKQQLSYDPDPQNICPSIKKQFKEINLNSNYREIALLEIIKSQAEELNQLKKKTAHALFLDDCYKSLRGKLNDSFRKPVDFESEKELRIHYFNMRDSVKDIIQILNSIDTRKNKSFRK